MFPDPELELAPTFSRPIAQVSREIEHMGLLTLEVVDDRVYVCGELDADSGSRLRERLFELGTVPDTAIDLDLSEVTFIDSGGLHALTRLCDSSAMVRVVATSDRVKRLLALSGLTEIVLGSVDARD